MLVARGGRAQLRTGNLLTGQLYVALDLVRDAPKAQIDWNSKPPQLPVIPGSLEDLKASIAGITKKIDKMDFEGIGADLQQTLKSTTKLVQRLDGELVNLTPELRAIVADARRALVSTERLLASDSPLLQDTREALREIARAAQAFRELADYLEQHPEALVSGKKEEKK